jgi:ribonuclease P protein component
VLPKSQRLNLKTDFKWVASGKKLEGRHAKLFIKFGENNSPRIGIATSSKVLKNATDRNRARRLISQSLQSLYNLLPPTINIVALPKAGVSEVKSENVLEDLKTILRNEKIINNSY